MDRLDAWITRDDDCGDVSKPCRAQYGKTRCEWRKGHTGSHLVVVWSKDIQDNVSRTWYGHFPKFKKWWRRW